MKHIGSVIRAHERFRYIMHMVRLRGVASMLTGAASICGALWAQTPVGLIDTSYDPLDPMIVAPGQVIKLKLTGIAPSPEALRGALLTPTALVAQFPLPTILGDISVRYGMAGLNGLIFRRLLLPIHRIDQLPRCQNGLGVDPATPECWVTVVTVQVPYDQPVDNSLGGPAPVIPRIAIVYRGRESVEYPLQARNTKIRIATDCDGSAITYGCPPVIQNSKGQRVRSASLYQRTALTSSRLVDAASGDTIVAYAYGLGRVVSEEPLELANPVPDALIPTANPIRVTGSWVTHTAVTEPAAIRPSFAGLVPGNAGLYQINLELPEPPRDLAECGGRITHNLLLMFDGDIQPPPDQARICVKASTGN